MNIYTNTSPPLFKSIWLYVKQHNVTGLKYFGKTSNNPHKYKGSGLHWARHLALHGNDVTTTWCELFTDKESLVEFALFFSEEFDIVQSNKWANLKAENGLDGNAKGTNNRKTTDKGIKRTASTRAKLSTARKGKSAWNKGILHTPDTKNKISTSRKLKSADPTWNIRPPCSKEKAEKIRLANTGKKWIHNPVNPSDRKQLNLEDCKSYIDIGWIYGMGR
jgi:hypothetical protein